MTAVTVDLPAFFDMRTLDATRDMLVSAFEQQRGVTLDAAQVERMGTVCVQLMMSAARTAQVAQVPFLITNASSLFLNVLKELGLDTHFSQWLDNSPPTTP